MTADLRQAAIEAAESVLSIFEVAYPHDRRPRLAIEEARRAVAADQAGQRIDRRALYNAAYAARLAAMAASDAAVTYAAFAASGTCDLSPSFGLRYTVARADAARKWLDAPAVRTWNPRPRRRKW